MTRYEEIGVGYSGRRHADPRIARQIAAALGSTHTFVNVGAGSGSYEPTDRRVVAVEPSEQMISQRPASATPVVRAIAEALPFDDDMFDCALASLTVHHWTDIDAGLAELRRVSRRQVLFTFDVTRQGDLWFTADYLPASAELEDDRAPTVDRLLAGLGGGEVTAVPIPWDCMDGFCGAYWRRPTAYLDPTVRRSISSVAMLATSLVDDAVARLSRDLASGQWTERYQPLLDRDELDLGYCLIVAGE